MASPKFGLFDVLSAFFVTTRNLQALRFVLFLPLFLRRAQAGETALHNGDFLLGVLGGYQKIPKNSRVPIVARQVAESLKIIRDRGA